MSKEKENDAQQGESFLLRRAASIVLFLCGMAMITSVTIVPESWKPTEDRPVLCIMGVLLLVLSVYAWYRLDPKDHQQKKARISDECKKEETLD